MGNVRVGWAIVVLTVSCGRDIAVCAQDQPALAFEVASVKTNNSGDARTNGRLAGPRFSMLNETLSRLIGEAYATPEALPRGRIIGGPAWIDSDRFDVEGVANSVLSREQARQMLRTLLAERFHLIIHRETREQPIYKLLLSRSDGKIGPQLQRSTTDCPSPRGDTAPSPAQASSHPAPCVLGFGFGRLTGHGMTVGQLASMGLSRMPAVRSPITPA
jgi:uncharacterized protein (TIGR03435 family)